MAPTGPAAAQAKRKGRRKKGKRRKSGGGGSGNGKAAPSAGPAATAAAAAAAQRIEEEKEQRARMVQLAKEYLQLWGMREQGSGWRFNKVRQTWVLHHLYDEGRVDSKMLKLALPYVAGLQGGARERVLAEAQGHVEAAVPKKRATGSDSDDDDDDEQKGVAAAAGCDTAAEEQAKAQAKRAKKLIKALGAGGGE